jgi:hypothetical protein
MNLGVAMSVDGTKIYIGGKFMSTDFGATWTTLTGSPDYYESLATSHDGLVLFGVGGSGVSSSLDGGASWLEVQPFCTKCSRARY